MAEEQTSAGGTVRRQGNKAFITAIGVSQICALLRYVVLARMLGPHELGLAVMIVLVGQFFDSVTDSGSDRFLIQHRDGDTAEARGVVQLALLLRGAVVAALLLLFAGPIAKLLDAPGVEFGLRLLACVPLLSGFVHVDLRAVQRDHDFRIEGRAMLFGDILSLATTATAAIITHGHIAIVLGLIVRMLTLAVVSQMMALRRFSARYSRAHGREFMLFGVPLMLNGLLLFFGAQGDRVFVGRLLGPEELGRYSAASLLIFYPIVLVQRYIAGTYLPQLIGANAFRSRNAADLGGAVVIVGSLATLGFALVAPLAMPLLFGQKFTQSLVVVALVGALYVARFIKIWPTNLLLAEGRSQAVLVTNVIRLLAFPLAIAGMAWNASLTTIIIAFLAGELVSIMVGLWLAVSTFGIRYGSAAARIGLFLMVTVLAVTSAALVQYHRPEGLVLAGIAGCILAAVFWRCERTAALTIIRQVLPERLHRGAT